MILDALRSFGSDFWALLPHIGPRMGLAWILTFIVVMGAIQWLRRHLKPQVLLLDDRIRYWAAGMRYRTRGQSETEIHARTWFFRFWTNFASAPSLSIISFVLAVWSHATFGQSHLFYLPGLCYAGSLLMSFISKRIIKRVRPERPHGAFGHKLKDGSFPSGHSLTSICFWIPLAIAVAASGVAIPQVVLFSLLAVMVVAFTGLSRIYLAVHFPSDVLGGYSIGLVWGTICCFILLPLLRNTL